MYSVYNNQCTIKLLLLLVRVIGLRGYVMTYFYIGEVFGNINVINLENRDIYLVDFRQCMSQTCAVNQVSPYWKRIPHVLKCSQVIWLSHQL